MSNWQHHIQSSIVLLGRSSSAQNNYPNQWCTYACVPRPQVVNRQNWTNFVTIYRSNIHKSRGLRPVWIINSLRPRLNRRPFADDIFKCIFFNENIWIPIKISLKFVPNGSINNIPALVQIMAWRRPGDKPLSEPMMVNLPTHICVTRPQWVNVCYKALLTYSTSWNHLSLRDLLYPYTLLILPALYFQCNFLNFST